MSEESVERALVPVLGKLERSKFDLFGEFFKFRPEFLAQGKKTFSGNALEAGVYR